MTVENKKPYDKNKIWDRINEKKMKESIRIAQEKREEIFCGRNDGPQLW